MKIYERVSPSRLAVLAAFFINGTLFATWVSRIPAIQTKLGLSEGSLGLILLGLSVGVLVSLSLAGGLVARYGSARVTIVGVVSMCLTLPLLAWAPHPIMLLTTLFLFGGAMSAMDVAMNEQAVFVERNARRPLMSSFHAAFSVGGLAGALIGAGMASSATITLLVHFMMVSVLFGGAMLVAASYLLPTKPEQLQENTAVFRLPERALWTLGAIAFCSSIGEGAMADWSAVYLTEVFSAKASFAALGFAAFSLTMTFGRMFGDALTSFLQPAKIVRMGGVLSTVGVLTAVVTTEPIIVLIGFAAVGIGLANIIPISFSTAGNHPTVSTGAGIASVATIGYAGFLAGPPAIGLIAEGTSLRIALLLVALLVGTLIFTAKAVES
ncbi:MAG: MFS transporter [Chloroflexi bacterium]|nr:MFS transporter [Chloroflexota bacterium]